MSRDGATVPRRLELNDAVIQSFGVGSVLRGHGAPVVGMDYCADGSYLLTSSGLDALCLINACNGTQKRCLPVRKHGAGPVRFLHNGNAVIASHGGRDNAIRTLSLASASYTQEFHGHENRVISLSASPVNTTFISGSADATMRVWDARQHNAIARLVAAGTPAVAFDPKGVVFGVCAVEPTRTSVKLYDCNKYNQGPFVEFAIDNPLNVQPGCFKFSSDGEYFLLSFPDANRPCIRVYDAYKGSLYRTFHGHRNDDGVAQDAAFSNDVKYVIGASSDGSLHIWHIASDSHVRQTPAVHAMGVGPVAFNPKYVQIASACQNVALWVPAMGEGNSSAY